MTVKGKKVLQGEVCWKIVKQKDGQLVSGFASASGPDYTLHYKKGVITKQKEGTIGVFAFDSRERAVQYKGGIADKLVVKAIGFGRKTEVPDHIPFCAKIWEYYKFGWQDQRVPRGTMLFEALTIVE